MSNFPPYVGGNYGQFLDYVFRPGKVGLERMRLCLTPPPMGTVSLMRRLGGCGFNEVVLIYMTILGELESVIT